MPNSLVHKFISAIADVVNSTLVRPSNWNEEHVFQGGSTLQYLMWNSALSDHAAFDNIWLRFPYLDLSKPPYNLTGDGTTDVTSIINSALLTYPWVYFPSGTYIISDSLLLQNNQRITLSPNATVRLKPTTTFTAKGLFHISGKSNVVIDGSGAIDGNASASPNSGVNGIHILDSSNITIRDISIANCDDLATVGGNGIYLSSTGNKFSLENLRLQGNESNSIYLAKGKDISIERCTIALSTSGVGVKVSGDIIGDVLQNIRIRNNYFTSISTATSSMVYCLRVAYFTISDNHFNGASLGTPFAAIRLQDTNYSTIQGNRFDELAGPGIVVDHLAAPAVVGSTSGIITGNAFTNCGTRGQGNAPIHLQTNGVMNIIRITIADNQIYDNRGGASADYGIAASGLTAAMIATLNLDNNSIEGPVALTNVKFLNQFRTLYQEFTIDFPSITGPNIAVQGVTVVGARLGDGVLVHSPNLSNLPIIFTGYVSASDTVTVQFSVLTGTVDPINLTYGVTVFTRTL